MIEKEPKDQKNWNKKMQDEYDQYPVAKWQNKKSAEVEELFTNSLKYKIEDDKVSVDVNFEVAFTKTFTKGDVYEWVEGLHRLVSAHSMIQMEKIINSNKEEKPFDEELSKREREFLTNLTRSQRWIVKKLN